MVSTHDKRGALPSPYSHTKDAHAPRRGGGRTRAQALARSSPGGPGAGRALPRNLLPSPVPCPRGIFTVRYSLSDIHCQLSSVPHDARHQPVARVGHKGLHPLEAALAQAGLHVKHRVLVAAGGGAGRGRGGAGSLAVSQCEPASAGHHWAQQRRHPKAHAPRLQAPWPREPVRQAPGAAAWHSTAWHSTAWHSTAWHSTAHLQGSVERRMA